MIGPACIFSRSQEQYEIKPMRDDWWQATGSVSHTMVGVGVGGDL